MLTEDRIDDMLRVSMFTNKEHKDALKAQLRSMPGEMSEDEFECVTGGVYTGAFFLLGDDLLKF